MARERQTASGVQHTAPAAQPLFAPRPRTQRQARAEVLDVTSPVLSSAVIRAAGDAPDVIVLVVDGAADDELTAATGQAAGGPSRRFAGAWSALIDAGGDLACFHLLELRGVTERRWALADAPRVLLEVALDRHLVALLPHARADELAGELTLDALRGTLIVRVDPSEATSGILLARWSREYDAR